MNSKENFISGEWIKILCFDLIFPEGKNIHLALNIQKIVEIVELRPLDIVPKNYFPIVGTLDYRNNPIPVVFLGDYFDKKYAEISPKARIIVCDFQKIILGLLVDQTKRIITIKNEDLLPNPISMDIPLGSLYNGLIKYQNEFIHLFDIEQLLNKLKLVPPQMSAQSSFPSLGSEDIPEFSNLKVLVVEDSKLFQKKMIQTLEKLKIQYLIANDGVQGLEIYEKNAQNIDVIFTDIEMPRLNGIGMVRKLKQSPQYKKIPIIFNTSISNPGLINDIHQENLGAFCIKFDELEIIEVLRRALSART